MKQSKRNPDTVIEAVEWVCLATEVFPELERNKCESADDIQVLSICEDLACIANRAHQVDDSGELLNRCYNFIRWSIKQSGNTRITGPVADYFFNDILISTHSKRKCLNYLDWGDVEVLMDGFTVEPSFDDVENFEELCAEWKKRWSLNQKLPAPRNPAEQDAAPQIRPR